MLHWRIYLFQRNIKRQKSYPACGEMAFLFWKRNKVSRFESKERKRGEEECRIFAKKL
jgi:hypothetical protein